MPKTDEGEFELVVGNRQLLSIVFIMMVLFGVVFTMGYFVGRNSGPEPAAPQASGAPASTPRSDASPPAAAASRPANAPGAPESQPGEAAVPSRGTRPVRAPAAGAASSPRTPDRGAAVEPIRRDEPLKAAAPSAQAAPGSGQTFLQVAAVSKPEAELIVSVFKKRGITALVAPVTPGQPEGGLWRALVGPLNDPDAVAKMRADLQAQGFKEVFIRKY